MYWLRRIPAETRIVVLVVFLALFQAILLSVFGLGAIRGERRDVENTIHDRAESFLRNYVAAGVESRVRDHADQVFLEAYGPDAEEWYEREPRPGGGLFTDAFTLNADRSILSSAGRILLLPRIQADRDDAIARRSAAERSVKFNRGEIDDDAKPASDLKFAEQYPFARDEFGRSLALLFAETPLLAGEGSADVPTLLRMRWIGELNRLAGFVEESEVSGFLARIQAAGTKHGAAFAKGVDVQQSRLNVLRVLLREATAFRASNQPVLHLNVMAAWKVLFYIRQVGGSGQIQVLAVSPNKLQDLIAAFVEEASALAAPEGHQPRLLAPGASAAAGAPQVKLKSLPGYLATAEISQQAVREQAAGRERFYWYIIAFSMAGILAGGFLTARVVMREVKLAKMKSGFVSNVSHELKTPLTSIRMFAEMLGSGKVTDEAERVECLSVITQETDRLGRLIQQVLDFGRLQARQRRFRWVKGPLTRVVEQETERFRRATGLPADDLDVQFAVNQPAVRHDADAFAEVVANLLSNAYKYSPKEGKRIRVVLGPRQGRVVLSVEDNGPGVPAHERRRIFEQFYRSEDLLTRGVEGTGLGLSIVRNIVRAHGGRILVEDGDLGGSRFLVILPRT